MILIAESGCAVVKSRDHLGNAGLREMVLWCHNNIEFDWVPLGIVTRSGISCWYFESEEDAMAFKLTWL